MYTALLADATFHDLLLAYDRDLADLARRAGCACGGVLHSAAYPRKPRPRRRWLRAEHGLRFSFCCAVDGCRSRSTPPSLRFLGRKVYLAVAVVLISIMRHGVSEQRMARLTEAIGVDRRTVARWRMWWRDAFIASSFWQMARAAFMPIWAGQAAPLVRDLPASQLIEALVAEAQEIIGQKKPAR